MIKFPKLPKKPYSSFQDFLRVKQNSFRCKKDILFPCLECEGSCRIYDPDDPPDVVEGYKMVRKINCPKCKGTGEGTREELYKQYRLEIENWRNKCTKQKSRRNIIQNALNKLSDEEIKTLNISTYSLFGIHL